MAPEHHTYHRRLEPENKPYDMPLCRLVANQPEPLWNNAWLKKGIVAELPIESIVDREVLRETGHVISFNACVSYEESAGNGGQ